MDLRNNQTPSAQAQSQARTGRGWFYLDPSIRNLASGILNFNRKEVEQLVNVIIESNEGSWTDKGKLLCLVSSLPADRSVTMACGITYVRAVIDRWASFSKADHMKFADKYAPVLGHNKCVFENFLISASEACKMAKVTMTGLPDGTGFYPFDPVLEIASQRCAIILLKHILCDVLDPLISIATSAAYVVDKLGPHVNAVLHVPDLGSFSQEDVAEVALQVYAASCGGFVASTLKAAHDLYQVPLDHLPSCLTIEGLAPVNDRSRPASPSTFITVQSLREFCETISSKLDLGLDFSDELRLAYLINIRDQLQIRFLMVNNRTTLVAYLALSMMMQEIYRHTMGMHFEETPMEFGYLTLLVYMVIKDNFYPEFEIPTNLSGYYSTVAGISDEAAAVEMKHFIPVAFVNAFDLFGQRQLVKLHMVTDFSDDEMVNGGTKIGDGDYIKYDQRGSAVYRVHGMPDERDTVHDLVVSSMDCKIYDGDGFIDARKMDDGQIRFKPGCISMLTQLFDDRRKVENPDGAEAVSQRARDQIKIMKSYGGTIRLPNIKFG